MKVELCGSSSCEQTIGICSRWENLWSARDSEEEDEAGHTCLEDIPVLKSITCSSQGSEAEEEEREEDESPRNAGSWVKYQGNKAIPF